MKSLKLAVIVSAVMLSVAGLAQAESSTYRLNHNFMSKRGYQAPVENKKATQVDEQFEGATLREEGTIDEDSVESKNAHNLKQIRINSFARRNY